MSRERFLRSVRLLAECYQAFERISARHVRELGLTPAQFDIVATLGNLPGLTFRELGAKTLITKGTLTGVVDRLEQRGVVARVPNADDGRSTVVKLTRSGQRLFERVFPEHIAFCRRHFASLGEGELAALESHLGRLRDALHEGERDGRAPRPQSVAA